jgi:hypothetical protein
LPNLAGEDYVMSGVNTISIIPGGSSCEGLSQGVTLGNNFARVTVAYAASTIPCRVGTCDPATGGCGLSNSPDGTTCSDGDACTQNDGCQTGACVGTPITAPPETTDLVATADKATYDWAAASYATRYDVVRGSLAAYPVGPGGDDETCFDNLPAAMLTDASVPAPGSGYWYVSRGENACGIGTFGAQSDGSPRITTTCP